MCSHESVGDRCFAEGNALARLQLDLHLKGVPLPRERDGVHGTDGDELRNHRCSRLSRDEGLQDKIERRERDRGRYYPQRLALHFFLYNHDSAMIQAYDLSRL